MNKSQHQDRLYRAENPPRLRRPAVACLPWLTAILLVGCDIPQRPVLDPTDDRAPLSAEVTSRPTQEVLEGPGEPFGGQWETWDAYFVRGRHVGYSHVEADSVGTTGDVRYSMESRLFVNRGRSRFVQRLVETSTETADGHLIRFDGVLNVGPAVTRFLGAVEQEKLRIETIRGSARSKNSIPWQSSYRGLVALEQSLRRRPMREMGERRTVAMLLPGKYVLATARLECAGRASVPLLDGKQAELLEINCEIRVDESQPSMSTIWTDDDGSILRTVSPTLNLVAYRTNEANAKRRSGTDSAVAAIPIVGKFDKPSESTRVAYRVSPTSKARKQKATIDIKPAPGQYIRTVDDGSLQILVSRQVEQEGKGFVGAELAPTDGDRSANYFIDSGATLIRRYSGAALSSKDGNDREVAIDLTRAASQMIDLRDDFSGFNKASIVARDLVGDATEHALLLAAMLRARAIPARLAIGLKCRSADPKHGDSMHGDQNRMVYHVWTLAHVKGEWIHLDATEGGLAAADRLVFSTTNLSGGNENEELIPFLDTVREIEIEVVGQN